MAAIYEPKGAAREYSPLAMNYITGCDHGCAYCLDGQTLLFKPDMTFIKIKDVKIGDFLLSVNVGTGKKSSNTRFTVTKVENKITTKKNVFNIQLENGMNVRCSADHRWLTDRGWKYTQNTQQGLDRPFLTINNKIRITTASFENTPLETDLYKKGYLSGVIRGDGHMAIRVHKRKGKPRKDRHGAVYTWEETLHQFALRLKDNEALLRSKEYLNYFGVSVFEFTFTETVRGIRTSSQKSYETIKELTGWSNEPEYLRGFLAGIYDAEGCFSNRTLRISNGDNDVISKIEQSLSFFNFKFIHDKPCKPKNITVKTIRVIGGESEHTRLWQITNPSILRKRTLNGLYVKSSSKVISITDLGYEDELFDITTSTETFFANGMVSHNCYVPKIMKRFRSDYVHSDVYIKEESKLMKEIESSCKKHRNSEKQVFLSFLTDPYSTFNRSTKLTRRVLEILLKYQIPVSILTKGGLQVLDDLDIIKAFGPNIQVGGSLTFTSVKDAQKWEPGAAIPEERFFALEYLHNEGIKTWASMEPVIYPEQSLEIMEMTAKYVDAYKIGKLNHFPKHEIKFDWQQFLVDAVAVMRKNGTPFYIKEDLRAFKPDWLHLYPEEEDMDFLALKNAWNAPTTAAQDKLTTTI